MKVSVFELAFTQFINFTKHPLYLHRIRIVGTMILPPPPPPHPPNTGKNLKTLRLCLVVNRDLTKIFQRRVSLWSAPAPPSLPVFFWSWSFNTKWTLHRWSSWDYWACASLKISRITAIILAHGKRKMIALSNFREIMIWNWHRQRKPSLKSSPTTVM